MKVAYTLANGEQVAMPDEYLALLSTALDFGRKEFNLQKVDASYLRDALVTLLAELDEVPQAQTARGLALVAALLELRMGSKAPQPESRPWRIDKRLLQ